MVLGGAQIKVNKISFIHRCDRYPVITLDANNKMSIVPIKGGEQCDNHGYVTTNRMSLSFWMVSAMMPCATMPCWVFDSWPQGLQNLWRLHKLEVSFFTLGLFTENLRRKNYQKRKCNLVRPNKPTGWFQGLVFHIQKSCLNFSIPTSSMEKSAISLPNNGTLAGLQPILASNNLDSL
jgi:hypothetical protein